MVYNNGIWYNIKHEYWLKVYKSIMVIVYFIDAHQQFCLRTKAHFHHSFGL